MNIKQSPILLLVALKNELEAIAIPKSIPVAYTGVGKINAATVTQTAIMHHQPQLIINFGTVGKINPIL
jgi:adenosylhomocysteine nucleosidase